MAGIELPTILRGEPSSAGAFAEIRRRFYDDLKQPHNPYGLTVLSEPTNVAPTVDIIFVHGLGGKSMYSWSKKQGFDRRARMARCWPLKWLAKESFMKTARISTFGYYATINPGRRRNTLNIATFSDQLLSDLIFAVDVNEEYKYGSIPIIFVVHSMGGLVVKKACVVSVLDTKYASVAQSTCSILFLATPHKGSDHASMLNRGLRLPFSCPREYVAELEKNAPGLLRLNEQFLEISNLAVYSFFETVDFSLMGVWKDKIVEEESAVSGHPREIVRAMTADHRSICKFSDETDWNYKAVLGVLKKEVGQHAFRETRPRDFQSVKELNVARSFLAVARDIYETHEKHSRERAAYSCQWIHSEPLFNSWLKDRSADPRILLVIGGAGSGKSVESSYVVDYIRAQYLQRCQFYYARSSEDEKGSLGYCLRSIAYQIACLIPEYRKRISAFAETGHVLDQEDIRIIWHELFGSHAQELSGPTTPLYWIIDGLDAFADPQSLESLMGLMSTAAFPLRVLFTCRPILKPTSSPSLAPPDLILGEIHMPETDLVNFIQDQIKSIRVLQDEKLHQELVDLVIQRSRGSFRWAKSALKQLHQCYEEESLVRIIEKLAAEPFLHYQQIDATLSTGRRSAEQSLARLILMWATHARRDLNVREVAEATRIEGESIQELHQKMDELCGDFISVDSKARLSLSDRAASEYLSRQLLPGGLGISALDAHFLMFRRCLSALNNPSLRTGNIYPLTGTFLAYAATSWFQHLPGGDEKHENNDLSKLANCLHPLAEFFDGPCVLSWIFLVASTSQLLPLVEAAQAICHILRNLRDWPRVPGLCPGSAEAQRRLQSWATDLIKISGRFGDQLVQNPRIIYEMIPRLSPSESRIHAQFSSTSTLSLAVHGISETNWGDVYARITNKQDASARRISCSDRYFAISTSSPHGFIRIFRSRTCEELERISHGERVLAIRLGSSNDLLASYGRHSTKVWKLPLGQQVWVSPNAQGANPLALTFSGNDEKTLLAFTDDRLVRKSRLGSTMASWQTHDVTVVDGSATMADHFAVPGNAAFNPDGRLLAVAVPGVAVRVYQIEPTCDQKLLYIQSALSDVRRVEWCRITGHIVGVSGDGSLFKWLPCKSEITIFQDSATDLRCSLNNRFLIVSYSNGTLAVRKFEDFSIVTSVFSPSVVADLDVSPDGRWIYDLRDNSCTIWEPTSLTPNTSIRQTRQGSFGILASFGNNLDSPDYRTDAFDCITALAIGRVSSLYCAGDSEGKVKIFGKNGKCLYEFAVSKLSVEHLAWSDAEGILVACDLANWIRVVSVEVGPQGHYKTHPLFEFSVGERVQQLLFNQSSTELVVVSAESLHHFNLTKGFLHTRLEQPGQGYKWANFPNNETLLLGVNDKRAVVVQWESLKEVCTHQFTQQLPKLGESMRMPSGAPALATSSSGIKTIIASQSEPNILLQLPQPESHNDEGYLYYMLNCERILDGEAGSETLPMCGVLEDMGRIVQIPIGIVHCRNMESPTPEAKAQLVFIDRNGWVCTTQLENMSTERRVRRFFFLPRHWLTMESLELIGLTPEGDIVCPRNGEVALIRNGLDKEWLDEELDI